MQLVRGLLDSQPIVLTVDSVDRASGPIDGIEGYDVEQVTRSTARDRVSELAVTCIAVDGRDQETADYLDLIEQLISVPNPPSVVLLVETIDSDTVAATHTDPGQGAVLLVTETGDELESAIVSAASRYLDRRADALGRAALDSLFEETERLGYLKDRSGRYLRYADGSEGADPETALGRTDEDLADRPEFDDQWSEQDRRVLSTEEPILGEVVERPGKRFESTVVPWRDATGHPQGVVGIRRRINESESARHYADSEAERLEQIARYISHDLRNPLVVADGYLDLAKEGDERALKRLEDTLARMEELIDELSVMARNRSTIETTIQQADLASVATETWDLLTHDDPTAELRLEVPEGALVHTAEAALRPLLENLCKNALVHGRADDSETVTVTVGTLRDGFYVADDGPGIPPAERERVFDDGYSSETGRTGDGLAIVADVANANGWDVSITESADSGARFEIRDCLLVPTPDRSPTTGETVTLDEITDVGGVNVPGEAQKESDGRWTITAEGRDIWQDRNDFSFLSVAVDGPVRIEGTVPEIDAPEPFSKAGLMIRDALDPESAHAYVGRNADHVIELLRRETTDEMTTGDQLTVSEDSKRTLRLDRDGDLVTVSIRDPEGEWQPIDQRRIDLGETVHVGLAVCSTVPDETATATFDDVTVRRLDG